MSKFKETCGRCSNSCTVGVGDSFDMAKAWYCAHGIDKSKPYNATLLPCIDEYRDEKEGAPDIPDWCPLPDIK